MPELYFEAGGLAMHSVTKLSDKEYQLLMKYKNKTVNWKHPTSSRSYWGNIVGIENGFLLVKDDIATEGILESWIQF